MPEFDAKLWEERHDNLIKKDEAQDKTLEDHENRIGSLEKSDVKQESKIDNLCEKLDGLIASNNKIFYALLTGMAGILVKLVFFK